MDEWRWLTYAGVREMVNWLSLSLDSRMAEQASLRVMAKIEADIPEHSPPKYPPLVIPLVSDRKWRLWAAACARHVPISVKTIPHWLYYSVIRWAEKTADGYEEDPTFLQNQFDAAESYPWRILRCCLGGISMIIKELPLVVEGVTAGRTIAGSLLEEIFGNPFRRIAIQPDWLACNGRAVERIARSIYASQDYSDLPILADALEDSGCDCEDLIRHLRDCDRSPYEGEDWRRRAEVPHVLGCWAIDRLLGKK